MTHSITLLFFCFFCFLLNPDIFYCICSVFGSTITDKATTIKMLSTSSSMWLNIVQFFSAIIIPLIITKSPIPLAEMQP